MLLTNQRHTGVGCSQPVDGHTGVVAIAILCHVLHCENWSGAEVLDVYSLAHVNPENRTMSWHDTSSIDTCCSVACYKSIHQKVFLAAPLIYTCRLKGATQNIFQNVRIFFTTFIQQVQYALLIFFKNYRLLHSYKILMKDLVKQMYQWFHQIFNIDKNKNVSWAPNKQICMIFEGSCNTKDLSNGCWKALYLQKE